MSPPEVQARTLLYKADNTDGTFISINVLEFVTVIIQYCAAYTAVIEDGLTEDDPAPVFLNRTDNTSSLNWTLHSYKKILRLGESWDDYFVPS